jgi:hypothetical protein
VSDEELARRYRALSDHYRLVGSEAGASRTQLLPGAERVYSIGEFLVGTIKLQFGWWHRLRMVVRYLPLRLRHLRRRQPAATP